MTPDKTLYVKLVIANFIGTTKGFTEFTKRGGQATDIQKALVGESSGFFLWNWNDYHRDPGGYYITLAWIKKNTRAS